MLKEAENPESELSDLVSALDRLDLLWNEPEKLEESGLVLVMENEQLKNYLLRLGVPGRLPRELPPKNPKARNLIERNQSGTVGERADSEASRRS